MSVDELINELEKVKKYAGGHVQVFIITPQATRFQPAQVQWRQHAVGATAEIQ